MPVLDPEISALIGTLHSLDDATAFRLGRLDQPCPDCVPESRCTVHSYDQRLAERYQARYAAAFSQALARLDPDAVVQVMRPGVRPATALLATTVLTRMQDIGTDPPAVTEREAQPTVIKLDGHADTRRTIHATYRRRSRLAGSGSATPALPGC